ncbi:Sterol 3-beta-glucosyltransferase [Spathaspora sp. JA1]|nr:Sterol 3-beta-glucosyltransferase [Spathaspora sp. JA1]
MKIPNITEQISASDDEEDAAKPCPGNGGTFFANLLKLAYVNSGISQLTKFGLEELLNRGDKNNRVSEDKDTTADHSSVEKKARDTSHYVSEDISTHNPSIDETLQNHVENLQIIDGNKVHKETSELNQRPDSLLEPSDDFQENPVDSDTTFVQDEIESIDSDELDTYPQEDPEILSTGKRRTSLVHKKEMTTLQASVIENLDPHSIKEGVLIKLKEGKYDNIPSQDSQQKQHLRIKIANKLQRSFSLSEHEYFHGNYSAWLVKDVLLQGHIYLTNDSLLFFAFLHNKDPQKDDPSNITINDDSLSAIQSGTLGLKISSYGDAVVSTVLTHRYWAILRADTLNIYSSSTELYFPLIVIDIKSCIYAEVTNKQKYEKEAVSPVGRAYSGYGNGPSRSDSGTSTPMYSEEASSEIRKILDLEPTEETVESSSSNVWIKLVTKKKTYKFQCDSLFVARKWCNNLTKLIFQHNNTNSNNEVLIKIPHSNIIEYNQFGLFAEGEDDKIEDENNDIPLGWSIKYYSNKESISTRLKKKIAGDEKDLEIDSVYFLFPKNGNDFFNAFNKIVPNKQQEHEKEEGHNELMRSFSERFKRDKSENSIPSRKHLAHSISTLTPSSNMLVQSVLDANGIDTESLLSQPISENSPTRKIGTTLINATKLFAAQKSPFAANAYTPEDNKIALVDSKIDPTHLSLPKNLTVSGLRSLDFLFETSFKQLGDAVSRYETNNNAITQEELFSTITRELTHSKEASNPFAKSKRALAVVGNKLCPTPSHYQKFSEDDLYYIKHAHVRERGQKHFRDIFGLGEDCKLISSYNCYLQRSFPVYGEFFIGQTEICFRSLLPGVSTKMIIPIFDVEAVTKDHGIRLAYFGVKIICKGHEEMILEFNWGKSRNDCYKLLREQSGYYNNDENTTEDSLDISENKSIKTLDGHIPSSLEISRKRIELARIKMFEDRLTTASGLDIPIILEDSPFFKTEMKPSTSYNITLLTIGSRGDVQPYISLGKGLIREGHKVTIATHAEFGPWIKKYGLQFKEIAGDPGELMSFMVSHSAMSVSFIRDAQAKFGDWVSKLLTSSWEACQGSDILIESPSAMAGIHIAEGLAIPYFRAFTMPWTKTRAYPNAFFVPDQKKGGNYNYLTHVLFETIIWMGISKQVNKWRVEELHLPKTNLFRLQQSRIPFLYNVSPSIFPPAVDFPDWVKVTGYWFLDEGHGDYQPPRELIEFMKRAEKDKKKIVYVGFGSIVVKDAASLTKAVVEAVVKSDVRCILNKGWSDRLTKQEVEVEFPKEIFNAGNIPHDWLFPRIDAVVHHGGSGTTGAALRAACPMIVKPFFGDQFFFASRVEDLGVGIALRKLTGKSLARAIVTITSDSKIVTKSKKLASKITKEYGVLSAIEAIYSELEYSRNLNLIKNNHNINYKKHNPDFQGRVGSPKSDTSGDSDNEFLETSEDRVDSS